MGPQAVLACHAHEGRARRARRLAPRTSIAALTVGLLIGLLALPASVLAAGWRLQTTPALTFPEGQLEAVSCPSSSWCTAVGYDDFNLRVRKPLAERLTGGRWKVEPTPFPAQSGEVELRGVSCPSRAFCLAVGTVQAESGPIAERWNGRRWDLVPVPSVPGATSEALISVSCVGSGMCIAVGSWERETQTASTSGMLVLSWNGSAFTVQTVSTPGFDQTDSRLEGVTCVSAQMCVAVGTSYGGSIPLSLEWDGAGWAMHSVPARAFEGENDLSAVSCASATNCVAVGLWLVPGYTAAGPLIERWDGTRWSLETAPEPPQVASTALPTLQSVACVPGGECEAVGTYTRATTGLNSGFAEAWDGSRWTLQMPPQLLPHVRSNSQALLGVACASARACIAAGSQGGIGGIDTATLSERWDGSSWRPQRTPPTTTPGEPLASVSCPRTRQCMAVGSSGQDPVASIWSGAGWHRIQVPIRGFGPATLAGVSCVSMSWCQAVGSRYLANVDVGRHLVIELWDGRSWKVEPPPRIRPGSDAMLAGVSCPNRDDCVAVGAEDGQPLAMRWNGRHWLITHLPTSPLADGMLSSVSCASARTCMAVGVPAAYPNGNAFAELWNGAHWKLLRTLQGGVASGLWGVSCPSVRSCVAVGSGIAQEWDGHRWRRQLLPGFFRAVSCSARGACVAVGSLNSATYASEWTGVRWRRLRTPDVRATNNDELSSVSCPTGLACTAVGDANITVTPDTPTIPLFPPIAGIGIAEHTG